MDSAKLNDWLQVVGLFGVIASLIFVGLQMKQDRDGCGSGRLPGPDRYDRRNDAGDGDRSGPAIGMDENPPQSGESADPG